MNKYRIMLQYIGAYTTLWITVEASDIHKASVEAQLVAGGSHRVIHIRELPSDEDV